MVLCRRNCVADGTYFFTVTLWGRSSDVLVRHVGLLRETFHSVRVERPITIDAIVILQDHLHAIWTLPDSDEDYYGRWRAIKSRFTRELRASGIPLTRDDRSKYRLWRRRFWQHTIRDYCDYEHHVDYSHWNSVKHGLTTRVSR